MAPFLTACGFCLFVLEGGNHNKTFQIEYLNTEIPLLWVKVLVTTDDKVRNVSCWHYKHGLFYNTVLVVKYSHRRGIFNVWREKFTLSHFQIRYMNNIINHYRYIWSGGLNTNFVGIKRQTVHTTYTELQDLFTLVLIFLYVLTSFINKRSSRILPSEENIRLYYINKRKH